MGTLDARLIARRKRQRVAERRIADPEKGYSGMSPK
jgi:hypothetical protein